MNSKIIRTMTATFFSLLLSVAMLSGQSVGINTNTPLGTLDIFSQGSSNLSDNLRIINSEGAPLLKLQDNGYLGLGTTSPAVRLDLRGSSGSNNIIGIGGTNLSASAAQGGALKYVPSSTELHYSDGTQWMSLEADMVRSCVVADNSYNMVVCPNNAITRLGSWEVQYDPLNSFDGTTGTFTAPKTGLYTVLFMVQFAVGPVQANSYLEGMWVASNGATIKSVNSFAIAGTFMTPIICSGTLFLNAGETLYPQVFHNMGGDKYPWFAGPPPGGGPASINFNKLSIVIQ
ncbi:hypothetical protein [Dysgonomonas sp. GY617]|uniref:hypothetical protein n=1 Tax=Dysgonomonas sp. GY617 TaxID=2780420 RepID=UPI0018848EDA|nr:hypothetical protein [Dysgonomonas sp. GY617]MBF0577372.1 hypothetical protein [Dysgonomonas sp. GY617]